MAVHRPKLATDELEEVRMVLYTREDEKAYAVYAQALEDLVTKAES